VRLSTDTNQTTMKTTYGETITRILSVYGNIATCQFGSEIREVHVSNIIR
jgi:hypothetical protein